MKKLFRNPGPSLLHTPFKVKYSLWAPLKTQTQFKLENCSLIEISALEGWIKNVKSQKAFRDLKRIWLACKGGEKMD